MRWLGWETRNGLLGRVLQLDGMAKSYWLEAVLCWVALRAPLGALLGRWLASMMLLLLLAWRGCLGRSAGLMGAWWTGEALPLADQGLGEVWRQLLWLGDLARMLRELAWRSLIYSVLAFSESRGAQRVRLAAHIFSILLESREVQVMFILSFCMPFFFDEYVWECSHIDDWRLLRLLQAPRFCRPLGLISCRWRPVLPLSLVVGRVWCILCVLCMLSEIHFTPY
jgi:hypothetical protein